MTKSRLGVAAIAAALLMLFPEIARADCKTDVECKGDRICEAGVCVSPASAKAQSVAPAPEQPAAAAAAPLPPPEPAAVPVPVPVPPPAAAPPPPPAPPARAPRSELVGVDFTTNDLRESYTISVGEEHCAVPCTLRLPPGPTEIVVSGSRHFRRPLTVEGDAREGSSMKVTLRHMCVGCYVFGGIATGVGVVSGLAAIAYAAALPNCDAYSGANLAACTADKKSLTVKLGVSVGLSVFALAVGLPSLATGGTSKPRIERLSRNGGSHRPSIALAPVVETTGGGAALFVSF